MQQSTPTIALNFGQFCSHRCVYCVSGMQDGGDRGARGYLEQVGWRAYADDLLRLAGDLKVVFSFAGAGECAEHPDFVPIVRALFEAGHFITLQTHGLSSKQIARAFTGYPKEDVAKRVNLHLSFHLAAYLDDKDTKRLDAFAADNFDRLADLGALICLIVPLSPKVLLWDRTAEYFRDFKARALAKGVKGFVYAALEFHGPYQGRNFPAEYNAEERDAFATLMAEFGNPSRGDMDGDSAIVVGDALYTKGVPCFAHVLVTEVNADGSLRHCQSTPVDNAGHLRDLRPLDQKREAKPCPYAKCHCISVGVNMALKPCGITMRDYADEMRRVTT